MSVYVDEVSLRLVAGKTYKRKLKLRMPHIILIQPLKVHNIGSYSVHETDLSFTLFNSNEINEEVLICCIDIDDLAVIQRMVSNYFTNKNLGIKALEPVQSESDIRAEKY